MRSKEKPPRFLFCVLLTKKMQPRNCYGVAASTAFAASERINTWIVQKTLSKTSSPVHFCTVTVCHLHGILWGAYPVLLLQICTTLRKNRPVPKMAQGGQLLVRFLPASPFRGDIVIAQFQQRSDLFMGDGAVKQYRDPVGFVHVICGQKAPFCQQ